MKNLDTCNWSNIATCVIYRGFNPRYPTQKIWYCATRYDHYDIIRMGNGPGYPWVGGLQYSATLLSISNQGAN